MLKKKKNEKAEKRIIGVKNKLDNLPYLDDPVLVLDVEVDH